MSIFRDAFRIVAVYIILILLIAISAISYADSSCVVIQSVNYPMTYINGDSSTIIEIMKERYYKSNCFIARIVTSNPHLLQTCFANDDRRTTGKMTKVAKAHDAVFMVNADWSSAFFVSNFIIRNGEIVKEGIPQHGCGAYFCVMDDGHLKFIKSHTPAKKALKAGVIHSFTFSTYNLVKNGEPHGVICRRAPRTFIGEVPREDGFLEYIIVVADGRSKESAGLHHLHEAKILCSYGCTIGYNLDGGGSSEMMFDGKVLNVPSDGHERRDHDFIYVKRGD